MPAVGLDLGETLKQTFFVLWIKHAAMSQTSLLWLSVHVGWPCDSEGQKIM